MRGSLLVLNAGSSSIKFSVFEASPERSLAARAHGEVSGIGTSAHLEVTDRVTGKLAKKPLDGASHADAIATIHHWFAESGGSEAELAGIGHRIVHGGSSVTEPTLIDDTVVAELEKLTPLAPLHQPHHIAAIRAVAAMAPNVPQVGCFDTAFHADQPPLAR